MCPKLSVARVGCYSPGMAGNSAGMAKAQAARMAKLAARRMAAEAAQALAKANDPTSANDAPTASNEGDSGPSLVVVDRSGGQVSEKQTPVAEAVLAAAEPEAANTVYRIASGRLRAPVSVRAQVSLAILQGRGLLGKQERRADADNLSAIAGALAKAFGLRAKAADAAPADVIEGESRQIPDSPAE